MQHATRVSRSLSAVVTVVLLSIVSAFAPSAYATDGTNLSNSVTINIEGGDANALAFCVNAAEAGYHGDVSQKNFCANKAVAVGGDVVLKNVTIDVFQVNTGDGDIESGENSIDLTIRGGDANALAACVNAAKTGSYSDVSQKNFCKNKAVAVGGDVILKDVDIILTQSNTGGDGTGDLSNSVTLTIEGGAANALAFCLNAAKTGKKSDVSQKNFCANKAIARGGDVVLKNVTIDIFQTNSGDGDISDAANTVDLTIRGGDANALAACVNAAKTGSYSDVHQRNYCRNKAFAVGGDVILKHVDIIVTQVNG